VNFVIAGGLFLGLMLAGGLAPIEEITRFGERFVYQLFALNVFLAVFNLRPAFPMDGGRVLRALLALRMDYARATRATATVGQGVAVVFALAGMFIPNFFLVFIALFVWLGAAAEASAVETQSAMSGLPVSAALIRNFVAIAPGDTMRAVARHVLDGFQQDFPVVEDGLVVGIVTRADLLAGRGPDAPAADVMRRGFKTAAPDEMLEYALSRLEGADCPVLPVIADGHLVGLLSPENVGELIMIREAMARLRPTAKAVELAGH
jgi:CBS domain-containing protein